LSSAVGGEGCGCACIKEDTPQEEHTGGTAEHRVLIEPEPDLCADEDDEIYRWTAK
jgi:hypothetical protein